MLLWIILPKEAYEQIQRDGVFRYTEVNEDMTDFPMAYDWLYQEATRLIGSAPDGAVTPLHGWLRWEVERERPDLRWMRWNWGPWGEHVLMQVDIPEDRVFFMDSHCWAHILNRWLIADNKEEHDRLEVFYDGLSSEEQEKMLLDNWHEKAFDIEYVEGDDWRGKGSEVEAVFWEVRKEQIRSAKSFVSKPPKMYACYQKRDNETEN